jgi:glycosyltransferase involved in cell wall biosynthesis
MIIKYISNFGVHQGAILVIYTLASLALIVLTLVCLIPVSIFTIECIAGILPRGRRHTTELQLRPSVAILIPAHNEALGIESTLKSVRSQIRSGDRIVVVADNCDDRTAEIARSEGAEVVERQNALKRGKGYALAAGIDHLRQAPPAIVVFVDADCQIAQGTLDALAAHVLTFARPAQALNLQIAPPQAGFGLAIAEFAFRIKNHVRPLGLARLGLPCLMTGTGMALPWPLLERVDLATGHQVEDMKFGLDLACSGHAPRFCEEAMVTSFFPHSAEATETQRERWEGGHLAMMGYALRAFASRGALRNVRYLCLLVDVLVPPLTLLGTAVVSMVFVSVVGALLGTGVLPLAIASATFLLFLFAVAASWVAFGTTVLPPASLLQVPRYVMSKVAKYPRMLLSGTDAGWVRTDRSGPR